MRIAVISDIHGNIEALKMVYQDIISRKVDLIISAGDLVGYGAFPNEVIEFIKEKNIISVMGNYDDGVGFERLACGCDYSSQKALELGALSLNWTIDSVSDDNKKYLRGLPKYLEMEIADKKILIVHGSPRRLNEYLYKDSEVLDEVVKELKADILVCGHTHIPYFEDVEGKLIVNAGSVGKPKPEDKNADTFDNRVSYVILELLEDDLKVEILKVEYDFEKMAKAIEKVGLPKEFADILRGINPKV